MWTPLRVSTLLAVRKGLWKVSRAFLICSLTALIINWGAIVPGQLSTVYSAPSFGIAELTQGCLFNFLNWQLLLTFMWKWSTVPKSRHARRNTDVHHCIGEEFMWGQFGCISTSFWLFQIHYSNGIHISMPPFVWLFLSRAFHRCHLLCWVLQRAASNIYFWSNLQREGSVLVSFSLWKTSVRSDFVA